MREIFGIAINEMRKIANLFHTTSLPASIDYTESTAPLPFNQKIGIALRR
jgi:hypothetical protein